MVAEIQAADIIWTNNSGGNWNATINWSPNQVPGPADNALITSDGTYAVLLNIDTTNAALVLGAASGTQTLVNKGFTLALTNGSAVNSNGVFKLVGGGTTKFAGLFNNSGSVQVLNGTLELGGGDSTGSFEIGADATLNFAGAGTNNLNAGSSVTGVGNFLVTGTTVNINGIFNVSGTNTVGGGTATFAGDYTITNNTLNLSGGTANFNAGGTVSPAILNLSGGTLGGTNTVTVTGPMAWTAGTITNSGLVNALGFLKINGDARKKISQKILLNATQGIWSAGFIEGSNGALLSNAATATLDFGSDTQFGGPSGSLNVANAGLLRKIGVIEARLGVFTNSGSVEVQSGLLHGYAQIAGLTLLNGGNITNGLQIRGGTLSGNGSVGRDLLNDSVVSPGISFGLLKVFGTYTQTSNGVLNIKVGGFSPVTSYDHLTVGGATLAGTLNLTFTNGFFPPPLATFTFLTYGARTGTFTTFNYPSNEIGMQIVYSANSAAVQVINVPPVLPPLVDQIVDELMTLTVNADATDGDLPAQKITYSLIDPPAGAGIDARGLIRWTPTEDQGPMTTNITVRVTDNGTPPLSAMRTFRVTVREVNTPPTLTLPPDQTIHATTRFSATAIASDADIPTNTLTFALVSDPSGLSVSPDGLITWPATDEQANTTNIVSVAVTDNGKPSLSATQSFTLTLVSRPILDPPLLTPTNAFLRWSAISGLTYRVQYKANLILTNWIDLSGDVVAVGTITTKEDTTLDGITNRFYRVQIVP